MACRSSSYAPNAWLDSMLSGRATEYVDLNMREEQETLSLCTDVLNDCEDQ
jgi:hypothetical protein